MTTAMALYDLGTRIAGTSTKALKVALISTGIGALIVLLGTLVATWMEVTAAAEDADQAQEDAATNDTLARAIQNTNALRDMIYADRDKVKQAAEEMAKAVREALNKELNKMKSTAEKFRDAIGLAFGTRGEDENSIFNPDFLIGKLRRVATAAKGFAENLKKLRRKGADESFINELVSMGPAQGNIVAKSLLGSPGKLSEILGLRGQIYGVGAQAQAQASIAGDATYEININKAVISASDIIREIKILEKKTGRKYLVN
jgi:hypothetical protein